MRILYTLFFLALTLSLSAQSDATKARAVSSANFILLMGRKGSGASYLTTEGAMAADGEIVFPVDDAAYGELLTTYEQFDHVTATVAGDEISNVTFPNGWNVKFTYADGEIATISNYKNVTWENNRPTVAKTKWKENYGKVKGGDWIRSAVYLSYDDQGRFTKVIRYDEFAKGKSLAKLKPQDGGVVNFQQVYSYGNAAITTSSYNYKLEKGKWVASSPTKYTLDFSKPGEVTYRSATGSLIKTFFYEDGKVMKDDMRSNMMGKVRVVTEYEFYKDWKIKAVAKKYSGDKVAQITTDNWEVVASEPAPGEEAKPPSRVYTGGTVTNVSGKLLRERKLGKERRMKPDGTWGAWKPRKGVGK